jgi:hypothetical protein
MTIKCKICKKEFKSLITNSHLKKHGITTAEYKEKYGPLSSKEYRKKRSDQYKGEKNPMFGRSHSNETVEKISTKRKGKKGRTGKYSEKALKNIKEGVKKREAKYINGELKRRSGHELSQNTKSKISNSVSNYAKNNKEELTERGKTAHQSALESNKWKAPMLRLKESNPEKYNKVIENSRESIKFANEQRSQKLKEKIIERISEYNLILQSEERSDQSGLWFFNLLCKNCNTSFSFTRQYFTDSKCTNKICPTCYPRKMKTSVGEKEIIDFVKTLSNNVITNDRTVLDNNRELDIYCPEEKIAIEFNGLYWHSESVLVDNGKDKLSDFLKHRELSKKGIQLITIFEDEWHNSQHIVKSILSNKFNKQNNKIYARTCNIQNIDIETARQFLNDNHLQGYNKCKIRLGLYHNNELVSMMTFSKHNISRKNDSWEIDRYATKQNLLVVGGASKLFSAFIKEWQPDFVISYADQRWSRGKLYKSLGFEKEHDTHPNYWYFRPNEMKRIHRFTLRKNDDDDQTLTEYENRKLQGYYRIWDCGSSKWKWQN